MIISIDIERASEKNPTSFINKNTQQAMEISSG